MDGVGTEKKALVGSVIYIIYSLRRHTDYPLSRK